MVHSYHSEYTNKKYSRYTENFAFTQCTCHLLQNNVPKYFYIAYLTTHLKGWGLFYSYKIGLPKKP